LGISKDDQVVAKNGVVSGGDGAPAIVSGSPETVAVFDDFLGDMGMGTGGLDTGAAGKYFLSKKGDTGTKGVLVGATNGVFRITPTTTATTATPAGTVTSVIGPQLAWKINQGKGANAGRLRLSCRVKKSVYSGGEHGLFVGFTDVVSAEMPFHDTGGTADKATATNAFGIGWNVSGDTGWVGYAVDGDTVQETVLEATAPTNNVWVNLEMEAHRGDSDTGGTVSFWIDGVPKGSINNPCNVTTALTPVIAAYDTGGAANVDIDWINVSAPRDTGS
jgi:hypothetical protein